MKAFHFICILSLLISFCNKNGSGSLKSNEDKTKKISEIESFWKNSGIDNDTIMNNEISKLPNYSKIVKDSVK
jgi:hypothetical protein